MYQDNSFSAWANQPSQTLISSLWDQHTVVALGNTYIVVVEEVHYPWQQWPQPVFQTVIDCPAKSQGSQTHSSSVWRGILLFKKTQFQFRLALVVASMNPLTTYIAHTVILLLGTRTIHIKMNLGKNQFRELSLTSSNGIKHWQVFLFATMSWV